MAISITRVTLCWVSFCLVSLCWVSLCWMSLCWMSLCWMSLCWMSLCLVSLCRMSWHRMNVGTFFNGWFNSDGDVSLRDAFEIFSVTRHLDEHGQVAAPGPDHLGVLEGKFQKLAVLGLVGMPDRLPAHFAGNSHAWKKISRVVSYTS